MATGSQNMTTYIAKQVIGDITNADWSGALLHSGKDGKSNSIDTWIFADDYGSASSNYGIKHNQTEDTIEFVGASSARTIIHLGKSEIVASHLVGGADTWYTARTFTVGNTGKSVNGSANVSWSKDEILGESTNAYFLRGDKVWSDTLNGVFTANGNITANGGMLKSTANGNTVTIGSQNTSFTHIYNSASIPFIFNNTVESTSGDLGTTSYPWNNIYIGKADGAGIYYVGSKNTYRMIRFIDNTGDIYGNGISIGGGGYTVIGSGESADTMVANRGYTGGSEVMIVASDGTIQFFPDNNSYDASAQLTMSASRFWAGVNGNIAREAQVGVQSGAGQLYMWSHASTTGDRGIYTPAHGSGSARAIFSVNTNNRIFFADSYNGTATALAYSQAGLAGSAISWMTCWNGYELRAISKAEVFNVVRDNGGDSRWVNVTGDTMTGTLTVTSTGNNRATVYIRSAGDVPMDLYLGSKNTNYWSISCRESANPYLGFYWAGSSGGWALLMHTNKHVEIPVHAYVGGYNNTSYALSTNSFICNSWVRTKGSTGWYNEDYSGGWYMTDVKWIRSYNSKPVLIDIGTNNAYGIGTHRLALGLAGGSHTSIMLKGGDVMYGFAVNNDGNWYFGRRTSKSFESTSGDAYLLYGSSTSFYPYTDNSVNLGASSKRWATCYAVDFHGYLNGNISGSSASCTGNAKTATTLQTARNINGTSFNGSANITTANWGTARNFTIKDYNSNNAGTAVSVNGSGAVTLLMPSTIYCADVRSANTRIVSNWIGFYEKGNAGGNRYGYISCDVNRMYFRKENSSTQDHYFDFGSAMYVNGAIGCAGAITTASALLTGSGITIRRDPSSGNCKIWFATNAAVNKWRIGVDGNDRFAISAYADGEGNYDFWVYNTGACYYKTSIGASSRYIKHNIRSLTMNTGNIIDRMEPVSFVFNNDPKETTNLGFIYEDLVKILPEVCFHGEGEDNNLGINYSGIIPVLVKEIQSLRKRLATVETELNYYRSKI